MDLIKAIRTNNSLRHLIVSHNYIANSFIEFHQITGTPMHEIDANGASIKDKELVAFLQKLPVAASVQRLSLSKNMIKSTYETKPNLVIKY